MKLLIVIVLVLIINSCQNHYPKKISKYDLEEEYDIALWRMYTTNFRNDYVYFYDVKTPLNIVSCELHFKGLIQENDTISFRFSFFYPDSNMNCTPSGDVFNNQIVFVDKEKFPYIVGWGLTYNTAMINNQKEAEKDTIGEIKTIRGIFHPYWAEKRDFEKFLKTTKHPLNPWLKKEAIKRGIIED